jgi:hypothetical protein
MDSVSKFLHVAQLIALHVTMMLVLFAVMDSDWTVDHVSDFLQYAHLTALHATTMNVLLVVTDSA